MCLYIKFNYLITPCIFGTKLIIRSTLVYLLLTDVLWIIYVKYVSVCKHEMNRTRPHILLEF